MNGKELIYKHSVVQYINDFYRPLGLTDKAMEAIVSAVEITPSVEAEPVRHGHWMPYENQNQDDVNNFNYLYVCSNCNYSDIHAKTAEVPYCWHCGAKMDEVTQ